MSRRDPAGSYGLLWRTARQPPERGNHGTPFRLPPCPRHPASRRAHGTLSDRLGRTRRTLRRSHVPPCGTDPDTVAPLFGRTLAGNFMGVHAPRLDRRHPCGTYGTYLSLPFADLLGRTLLRRDDAPACRTARPVHAHSGRSARRQSLSDRHLPERGWKRPWGCAWR